MGIAVLADEEASQQLDLRGTGRLNNGADGGELAKLRTPAAAPEGTLGADGFRASAVASNPNRRWTFSAEDAAGSSVLGRQYRDSVSVVVENEAQSTSCFCCGKANAADCLDLPAKRVSLRHSSNVVLVGRNRGCRMGRFGIRRCGFFVVVVLAFLR